MTAAPQSTLRVGDSIKDNDPRMGNRVLTILEVLPFAVMAETQARRVVSILSRRIYTDGKPRRTGYSLLEGQK